MAGFNFSLSFWCSGVDQSRKFLCRFSISSWPQLFSMNIFDSLYLPSIISIPSLLLHPYDGSRPFVRRKKNGPYLANAIFPPTFLLFLSVPPMRRCTTSSSLPRLFFSVSLHSAARTRTIALRTKGDVMEGRSEEGRRTSVGQQQIRRRRRSREGRYIEVAAAAIPPSPPLLDSHRPSLTTTVSHHLPLIPLSLCLSPPNHRRGKTKVIRTLKN